MRRRTSLPGDRRPTPPPNHSREADHNQRRGAGARPGPPGGRFSRAPSRRSGTITGCSPLPPDQSATMTAGSKQGSVNPFTNQRAPTAEGLTARAAVDPAAEDEADLIETVRQMIKESGLE